MAADLDELLNALRGLEANEGAKATSLRLPEALHRAVLLATKLGMDSSFSEATTRALTERLQSFVRAQALAGHFARFPVDVPSLAEVVHRRILGTDHPGVSNPGLVEETAAWVQAHHPDWAVLGVADETVDLVLEHVEMLTAGVGEGPPSRS